tara:strand:+ start:189 stop:689 length:501 start_codon:yes stop_codon:yes gene_type:complete
MVIKLTTNYTAKQWLQQLRKREKFWGKRSVELALRVIGKQGIKELKKAAPSKSGKLKGSFAFKTSSITKLDGKGVFTSKVEYAQFVNDGTDPSIGGFIPAIERRLSKRFIRGKGKEIRSTKKKMHPGTKPNPYQKRAFKALERSLVKNIKRELRRRGVITGPNKVT